MIRLFAFLSFLVLSLLATAQEGELPCVPCGSTGRVRTVNQDVLYQGEDNVLFCANVAGNQRRFRGMRFRPCPLCKFPDLAAKAREEYDEGIRKQVEWYRLRQPIDRAFKSRLRSANGVPNSKFSHCTTEHFDLTWGTSKHVMDGKVVDRHGVMHRYVDRLEALCQSMESVFGTLVEERLNLNLVTGPPMAKSLKKVYRESLPEVDPFVVIWQAGKHKGDDRLHELLVHQLVDKLLMSVDLSDDRQWVSVGAGHHFAHSLVESPRVRTGVLAEQAYHDSADSFADIVRQRLESGVSPDFAALSAKAPSEFTSDDSLFAWSWVEFLMQAGHAPDKWQAFLKDPQPVANALESHFGASVSDFLEAWKQFASRPNESSDNS